MKNINASNAPGSIEKLRDVQPILRITATVFHVIKQESYYEVQFRTVDGERKKSLIARELFQTPARVVDELIKAHAELPDERKAAIELVEQAILNKGERKFHITNRTGWYQESFVYLTDTFGNLKKKLRHEGHTDFDPALGLRRGTVETWREGLRLPCTYSDFLIFTIAVAASGPLLDIVGEDEGGIFHLQPQTPSTTANPQVKRQSSSGKTLAARTAMSTVGRCRKSDLTTFAVTNRGVEDYCFAHNHLVAVFDEEARALSGGQNVKAEQLPYLVASGVGKLRSKKATQDPNLKNLRWSLPALSTGENPLDDPAKRLARPEGAQARMIPVPVPPGGEGGIFNRVDDSRSKTARKCRKLAKHVEDTIERNYGTLMPAYLEKLAGVRQHLRERVRRIVERFVADALHGQNSDPWEQRFASKFGLALAAAILMAEFNLAWTKKRTRKAIATVYKKARATSVSKEEAADTFVRRLRKLVSARKRFPKLKKGQKLTAEQASNAWGAIVKLADGTCVLAIPHSRVARLIRPSAVSQWVIQVLCKRGIVLTSKDGKKTRQLMIKGLTGVSRQRFVCFLYKGLAKSS